MTTNEHDRDQIHTYLQLGHALGDRVDEYGRVVSQLPGVSRRVRLYLFVAALCSCAAMAWCATAIGWMR